MELLTVKNGRIVSAVLCILLFVLGMIIVIPMSLLGKSVGGKCLLYADGADFGPTGVCSYLMATASIFQLIFCLLRAVFVIGIVIRVLKSENIIKLQEKKAFLIGCFVVDCIACVLTLVSGGMVSHGYNVMCGNVFRDINGQCGTLNIYSPSTASFVIDYGRRIKVATCGVWMSWFFWIGLLLVDLFLLHRGNAVDIMQRFRRGNRNSNQNDEQPRTTTTHIFRPSGRGTKTDRDDDSLPRTPPPTRPVPPRPAAVFT